MEKKDLQTSHYSAQDCYNLLHPAIQKWIYRQGWDSLRKVQILSIPYLIEPTGDLLISAGTAGGKTEAAFLPIISYTLNNPNSMILCVSPLRALINDQFERLSQICEPLSIQVTPWHGDIPPTKKQAFSRESKGILLITPESLEAMFVSRGYELASIFEHLKYIVIDEIHSFIGTERGKQLQSLICRISNIKKDFVPRIGLSATLGDLSLASSYLRKDNSEVKIIKTNDSGKKLNILLYGIEPTGGDRDLDDTDEKITNILFDRLYDSDNLVFPNSRGKVEEYTSRLSDMCQTSHIPTRFFPHHGSLSSEIRKDSEEKIKSKIGTATIIATTTLELGIDIGSVRSIAQIGSPPSVAALRQRIGRSGRNVEDPSILRCFVKEPIDCDRKELSDLIAQNTLEAIAMINLMCRGWVETPNPNYMHLSTFVQQILSSVAQYGGMNITKLWDVLVVNGAFVYVDKNDFISIVKSLGKNDLLMQDDTKTLYLGRTGEKIVNNYNFYSAFTTNEEYRIVHETKTLGTLPITRPITVDSYIIFAGRKWKVKDVDNDGLVVNVVPAKGGKVPKFEGNGFILQDEIRAEMKEILMENTSVPYLDSNAKRILARAREYAVDRGLSTKSIISNGNSHIFLLWKGDRINNTIVLILNDMGIEAINNGCYIEAGASQEELLRALDAIKSMSSGAFYGIISKIQNLNIEKWDYILPQDVKIRSYADTYLDLSGAKDTIRRFCGSKDMN
ncbi:MAG: DEAD/DEAH box helicase [Rickettsiales bacterium]|nr:DEAD/DEAH box helicase [Rickettsiales bacterium]